MPGVQATARVRVRCSRGTYIRTLAHDLGRALQVGGHVATLRRVRIGPFVSDGAVPPGGLTEADLRPVLDAVQGYARREVTSSEGAAVAHGRALPAFGVEGPYAVVSPEGLVAMSEDRGAESRPICVVGASA